MKKGQIIIGSVSDIRFPNKGIMIVSEETENGTKETEITIKNALPGQKVAVAIRKLRNNKAEGVITEVLEEAQGSRQSPCIHFPDCGGCLYQRYPYEEQLKIKESQVKALLHPVIHNAIARGEQQADYSHIFEGILPSPREFGYRNKMEFTFGDEIKDGALSLGMHKRGSFYDIVCVDQCRIADADFGLILQETLRYFTKKKIPYFHRMRHTGYLRHLCVRKAAKTGEILVNLVTTTAQQADLAAWAAGLSALQTKGRIVGIIHTMNDSVADTVQKDDMEILFGQDYFYEELLGLRFRITPFSFFQTNSLGAEVLYGKVREYLGEIRQSDERRESIVYDLYSGTGTIAQLMAPVAGTVIGVEIVKEAVEAAIANAKDNGLDNCCFFAGDVLKVLDEITEKPDYIILDPPRDGVHPRALQQIISYGVKRIVYVSCKPTSLARDLEVLLENGYRAERICCVDMFPATANVETVVLLSQQKPDDVIEVEIELDELDLTSAESKATYKEIQEYVLKEHGLKVSNLYISQVKRKCGIEVGENYNLPKSEDSRQPQCPVEKEKAIKDALEHFGMV